MPIPCRATSLLPINSDFFFIFNTKSEKKLFHRFLMEIFWDCMNNTG